MAQSLKKNKETIKANIEKYHFVRNKAASNVRGINNQLVILRTVIKSTTLDNVVAGIIDEMQDVDVIVKYCGLKENEVIKSIEDTLEEKPRFLVVFAPTDVSSKFEDTLKKAKDYTKVVVFNYNAIFASSLTVDLNSAISKLSNNIKEINFIYKNKDDVDTFLNRVNAFEHAGVKVNVSRKSSLNMPNFYQTEGLYLEQGYKQPHTCIVLSYRKPTTYSNRIH